MCEFVKTISKCICYDTCKQMPFGVKDITVLITNFYLFLFNLWERIIKTPTAPSKVVQHNEVGECVVQIVAVGWIVQRCPILGQRRVLI